MILDNNLVFSSAQAMTTDSDTRSQIIDLATGVALATTATTYSTTPNLSWGRASVFGEDLGIGNGIGKPRVWVSVATLFTTGNAATLNIAFQTGLDPGTGTISGITWTTAIETGPMAVSLLTANARIAAFDVPRRAPGAALPRFWSLLYDIATGQWTAGALNAYIALETQENEYYGPNFTVAA